ncbi:MAG: hypothetical protein GY777_02795 [Candidatus Brocadiaceae bacterium]|nr:hypothetical protein [Candidatus Brocadiaceae bacterium]
MNRSDIKKMTVAQAKKLQKKIKDKGPLRTLLGLGVSKRKNGRLRIFIDKSKGNYFEVKNSDIIFQDNLTNKEKKKLGIIIIIPSSVPLTVTTKNPKAIQSGFLGGDLAKVAMNHAVKTESQITAGWTVPLTITIVICVPTITLISYLGCTDWVCETGTLRCDIITALEGCPSHWCDTSAEQCKIASE